MKKFLFSALDLILKFLMMFTLIINFLAMTSSADKEDFYSVLNFHPLLLGIFFGINLWCVGSKIGSEITQKD